MPAGLDPAAVVWNVFLSSTVRDLDAYRLAIRTACLTYAQTTCLLGEEDWPGGYQSTVDKCLQQLAAAQGYVLVMGHWYGSIPPVTALPAGVAADRSITHLEFDAAFQRWQQAKPRPMAVMVPKPGSDVDNQLRAAARQILIDAGISEAEHAQRLERFRTAVTGHWNTVDHFKDQGDLLLQVVVRCLGFRGQTPSAAAAGLVQPARSVPVTTVSDAQLGALGRAPHLAAARAMVAGLANRPDVPALAMVVSGDQNGGQRAFLQRLIATVLKKYLPRREPATLPVQCDTSAVLTWIAQLLALPPLAAATPESLADAVASELKRQPLMLVIDRIGDLADGVNTFREEIWRPFYQELSLLRARDRFVHRLVAVVADYSGDPTAFAGSTADAQSPDGTLLRLLPALDRVTRDDLLEWFDEFDVPDDAHGRRAALADRVMKDSSQGVPLHAFTRLRGEVLWPEGADDE